jgi:NAD(P)H-hydrate epimerase
LAGFSALKIGTGLVTTALPKEFQNTFLTKAPEMMTLPQESVTVNQLKKYDAVVIGCGLGRDKKIWRRALPMLRETEHPILFDADAFYGIDRWETIPLSRSVLTPHPGEFARMSGYAKPKTNRERIDQGVAFIEKYPTTLVLKGAPTLIFDPEGNLFINETGNPGMATAGSGDVLSGIIGGLLAQGLTPSDASLLGVWLHGGSGDSYRDARGEESLTATSLIERLPESIRRLTTTSD